MMKEDLNSRGDDFEKRLQRVPQNELPSTWREEILTAANQAASVPHAPRPTPSGFLAILFRQLSALTHPRLAVWSGLAATWIVIAVMNFSARDHSQISTAQHPLPSTDALQAFREQKLFLLTELASPTTPRETIRPKTVPVGPRSQRRGENYAV
jgi:hypothetical protein